MKKKSLLLFTTIFLFLFTSCQGFFGNNKTGLTIRLPGEKYSRTLGDDGETLYFTILCEKDDGSFSIPQEGESGDELIFEDLTPGKYTISGEAYSDEEKTILKYTGQVGAVVTSGVNTPVHLVLRLVDGGSGDEEEEILSYSYSASGDDILYLDDYFNSIELTQYKTVDGGLVETGVNKSLSDLAAIYDVYIGGSLVNSAGKLEDNSDVIKSFVGKTLILITDKDNSSNVIETFNINIKLNSMGIAVFEGEIGKDFSTLVITEDNIESLIFKPFYSYGGNTYSLSDLPIKKVFNASTGSEITGFTFGTAAYWQWTSSLVAGSESNSFYSIRKDDITDFTDNKNFSVTCEFNSSDFDIKTSTVQKSDLVLHKKKLEIVDNTECAFGRNYLDDIEVKEYYLVDEVKNYISGLPRKYLLNYIDDYDIYVGNNTVKETATFDNKYKYLGGVPVKVTEKDNSSNVICSAIAKVLFNEIVMNYSVVNEAGDPGSGQIDAATTFYLSEINNGVNEPDFSITVKYTDQETYLPSYLGIADLNSIEKIFNSSGVEIAENIYKWTFTFASEHTYKTGLSVTFDAEARNPLGLIENQYFTIEFALDVATLGYEPTVNDSVSHSSMIQDG